MGGENVSDGDHAPEPRVEVVARLAAYLRTPEGMAAAERALLWRCVAEGHRYQPAKAVPSAAEAQEALKEASSQAVIFATSEASDLEQLASFLRGSPTVATDSAIAQVAEADMESHDTVMLTEMFDGCNPWWEGSRNDSRCWGRPNTWEGWMASKLEDDNTWWSEASWSSGWWELCTRGSDGALESAHKPQAQLDRGRGEEVNRGQRDDDRRRREEVDRRRRDDVIDRVRREDMDRERRDDDRGLREEVDQEQAVEEGGAHVEFVRMDSDVEDSEHFVGTGASNEWELDWNDLPGSTLDNKAPSGGHACSRTGASDLDEIGFTGLVGGKKGKGTGRGKGKGKGRTEKRTTRKVKSDAAAEKPLAEKPSDFAAWCEQHQQPAGLDHLEYGGRETSLQSGEMAGKARNDVVLLECSRGRQRRTDRGKGRGSVERLERGGKGNAGKGIIPKGRMTEEAEVNYAFVVDNGVTDGQRLMMADETDSQTSVQMDALVKKIDMQSISQTTAAEKSELSRSKSEKCERRRKG